MAGLDDLMSIIPIDDIATKLGVDKETAASAVSAALPALVSGMAANAEDPAGAASLSKALATKDTSLVEGGVNLDDVDDEDGAKIVHHVFGDNENQVIAALGSTGKADGGLLSKLLPMLAPIVMAFLANKLTKGGASSQSTASSQEDDATGGGLGDLLGGLLGGGSGGGLGDVLGGLLGGGSGGSGGGLGDLLGGLLGGGRK